MLSQLQIRSTTREYCRAVVEEVNRTNVGSVSQCYMIEKTRTVNFLRCFESVDLTGDQFALNFVAFLGGLHALAR